MIDRKTRFGLLVVCGLMLTASLPGATAAEKNVVVLSNHPQLFLDDHLVAGMDQLKRVLQQPTKHPDNPLRLEAEYAWERLRLQAGSVIYDAPLKKFRMWYVVMMDKKKYADEFGYVCYAESTDGIRWTKPMLNIHEFEGQTKTNIVSKGPTFKDSECLFSKRYQDTARSGSFVQDVFHASAHRRQSFALRFARGVFERWASLERAEIRVRGQV